MNAAPKPNVTLTWVLMTPPLATEWLERNTIPNRNPRLREVTKYATDMRDGNWASDASDPICRDTEGNILDGQHRLMAVIESGTSVWLLVADGVARTTQAVKDTGIVRKYADQVKMQGRANYTTLAAVARWAVLWERGERIIVGSVAPTHSEMEAALVAYPELEDAAQFAAVAAKQLRIPPSAFGMAHWLLTPIDKAEAVWFLSRVADGVELTADHPAYAFRRRVQQDREQRRRIRPHVHLALVFLAWNAYRDGRPMTRLQLPKGGLTSGNYPVPR